MTAKDVIVWLVLNLVLLLAIFGIVRGWLHSRPMTGGVLARSLAGEEGTDGQRPDLTFGETAFLLREIGRPDEGRLFAAVLTLWQEAGWIACEMAPKKRLASFGEDMQPALSFTEPAPCLAGAEEALFLMMKNACSETLQASEGYNWARGHAAALRDVFRRFEAEGRARLRAEGAVRSETRRGRFGTARQERLIYTPRGLRRALAMRRWENHLGQSPEDGLPYAVLFGCSEPPQPLGMFCKRLMQGYTAGLKSG